MDAAQPAMPPAPEAAGFPAAASPSPLPLPRGAKKRAARAKWSAASVAALMAEEATRQGLFLTSTRGATIRAALERTGKLASGVRTTHLTMLLKAHRSTGGCGARCACLARHPAADAPRACIRSALVCPQARVYEENAVTRDGRLGGATPDLAANPHYLPWAEYVKRYGSDGSPPAAPPRR